MLQVVFWFWVFRGAWALREGKEVEQCAQVFQFLRSAQKQMELLMVQERMGEHQLGLCQRKVSHLLQREQELCHRLCVAEQREREAQDALQACLRHNISNLRTQKSQFSTTSSETFRDIHAQELELKMNREDQEFERAARNVIQANQFASSVAESADRSFEMALQNDVIFFVWSLSTSTQSPFLIC